MARLQTRLGRLMAMAILAGTCGCLGHAALPIPVPPWVSERMEEKYCDRFKERTAVMPPILPGTPLPTCEDPPSEEEVIRALPRIARGIPFVYEEFRDDFQVVVEKLVDTIDPPTVLPLLGPVQIHHCHYKCTVYFKERLQSSLPFPFMCENDRVEVVYIDKDHPHLYVGADQRAQREVTRDLSGP